jgi:protein ImuA
MAATIASTRAAQAELRQRIERASSPARARTILPFGLAAVDSVLPGRGLALGAVHELCEGGTDAWRAPLATLFAAGILARPVEGAVDRDEQVELALWGSNFG